MEPDAGRKVILHILQQRLCLVTLGEELQGLNMSALSEIFKVIHTLR